MGFRGALMRFEVVVVYLLENEKRVEIRRSANVNSYMKYFKLYYILSNIFDKILAGLQSRKIKMTIIIKKHPALSSR